MSFIKIRPEGGCGLCGYIWQVLRGIYHNPNEQYYIDFETCIYNDESVKKNNVWDYYFYQPHVNNRPSIEDIKKTVGIIDVPESEFRFNYLTSPSPQQIQGIRERYNNIIKQYLKPLPHITEKINSFSEKNFSNKRVLGIHFRGTDHPDKLPMKRYMPLIKQKIKDYDVVYVATDDDYRYKFVKAVFGEKVITYDSLKSSFGAPLHHSERASGYQYKIGEDVIIEAFLLAKTDFLFCFSNSNVNFLSRCINPNLEYYDL